MLKKLLFVSLALMLVSCGNSTSNNTSTDHPADQPASEPLAQGKWGARNIGLKIQSGFSEVAFLCANGRIDGDIIPDQNGKFTNNGTITVFFDGQPSGAVYSGSVNSDRTEMSLRVRFTLEGQPQDQSYTLTKGADGPIRNVLCALHPGT